MDYHPFAEPWPLMEGDPFDELVEDVRANGLRVAILTYKGKILDGRNRDRACALAGVKPRYEEASVESDREALALSKSLNKHRRHLSDIELGFVAAKIESVLLGTNRFKKKVDLSADKSKAPLTRKEIAESVGVDKQVTDKAKAILKYKPELEKEVKSGKKSFSAANEEARRHGRGGAPPRPKRKKGEVIPAPAPRRPARQSNWEQLQQRPAGTLRRDLTREQVDPEFVGTAMDFVDEYGHVQMETALDRATSRFGAWAIVAGHVARVIREQQAPRVTPRVVSWLRRPKLADVARMRAALAEVEAFAKTARELLDQAELTGQQAPITTSLETAS